MPKINLPIDLGFYVSDSLPIAAMECDNWYPNTPQTQGAVTTGNLFGTPGLNQVATTGILQQINRGAWRKGDVPYFVNGETLFSLNSDFTINTLGAIPGTSRLSFSDNGKQLMVLDPDSGNGWIVDETSGTPFQQITDLDFTANGKPQYVVFADSFFICSTDTNKFIKSNANDGLSWVATDFGSAEKDPDPIVAPIVFRGELFVTGSETIQSFNNNAAQAGASFPYQASGLVLPKGCFAPFSLVSASNTFMWIGGGEDESPAIWAFTGNDAQKVSTTAIDSALQRFTDEEIKAAFAISYAQKGAYFICWTVANKTFCYDTITSKWHTRSSAIKDIAGTVETQRWRVNSLVTAYGKVLCGDSIDGRIGELDIDVFTEYGENIRRTVTTANLENQLEAYMIPEMEATVESGVALSYDPVTQEGANPEMRLSWSDDGGKTYTQEISKTMGKIGEYMRRVIWSRLGRASRFRLFKFEYSEPFKAVLIRIDARIKVGQRGR